MKPKLDQLLAKCPFSCPFVTQDPPHPGTIGPLSKRNMTVRIHALTANSGYMDVVEVGAELIDSCFEASADHVGPQAGSEIRMVAAPGLPSTERS
jgi:hypothetical protein